MCSVFEHERGVQTHSIGRERKSDGEKRRIHLLNYLQRAVHTRETNETPLVIGKWQQKLCSGHLYLSREKRDTNERENFFLMKEQML